MRTQPTPPPINVSTSSAASGGGAGRVPPRTTAAGAAGSDPGDGSGAGNGAGGAGGGGAGAAGSEGFFSRYQNVTKNDLDALKKGLKAVGGAALATLSFGYGFSRQAITHPIRTAQDVKAELAKLAQKISAGTKGAVQGLEEKLLNAEVKQLTGKINSLPGLSNEQKRKVTGALHSSFDRIITSQANETSAGSLLTLPVRSGVHLWKTMSAVRSHERVVDVMEAAAKFSDKYGQHYPDKCSGYFEKIVDDMADGHMSPFEWIARRAQLAAAGITNRVLRAVDPFSAHAGHTGARAAA